MNALARSFTFTRRNEKVVGTIVITQAKFTRSLFYLIISIMNAVEFTQKKLFLSFISLFCASNLNHSILHSTQFDYISRT